MMPLLWFRTECLEESRLVLAKWTNPGSQLESFQRRTAHWEQRSRYPRVSTGTEDELPRSALDHSDLCLCSLSTKVRTTIRRKYLEESLKWVTGTRCSRSSERRSTWSPSSTAISFVKSRGSATNALARRSGWRTRSTRSCTTPVSASWTETTSWRSVSQETKSDLAWVLFDEPHCAPAAQSANVSFSSVGQQKTENLNPNRAQLFFPTSTERSQELRFLVTKSLNQTLPTVWLAGDVTADLLEHKQLPRRSIERNPDLGSCFSSWGGCRFAWLLHTPRRARVLKCFPLIRTQQGNSQVLLISESRAVVLCGQRSGEMAGRGDADQRAVPAAHGPPPHSGAARLPRREAHGYDSNKCTRLVLFCSCYEGGPRIGGFCPVFLEFPALSKRSLLFGQKPPIRGPPSYEHFSVMNVWCRLFRCESGHEVGGNDWNDCSQGQVFESECTAFQQIHCFVHCGAIFVYRIREDVTSGDVTNCGSDRCIQNFHVVVLQDNMANCSFTFWKWVYACLNLIKSRLKDEWKKG